MRVLIFGGTTEGRQLAQRLSEAGLEVAVSVATDLGAEELEQIGGLTVLVGRRTTEEMVRLLAQFDCCVDATHPYAVLASQSIRAACEQTGVPLRRLVRGAGGETEGRWVDSAAQAAEWLRTREGNVLLTTGAKELGAFSGLSPERLFPRVLPVEESIAACRALGVPTRNIIAMHGPFSQRLNEAVLEEFQIRFLVTKDGGRAGGFMEKVSAARNLGVELVIIRRPVEEGDTLEEVVSWLAGQEGEAGCGSI